MIKVGFIGLGQMGRPMARNLVQGGHTVQVHDTDTAAMAALADHGAIVCASVADCAAGVDVLITMLPNGDVVKAVLFDEGGAADALPDGAWIVDMSTVHPLASDGIAKEATARGFTFVDAPVGRTSDHAEKGQLLVLAGTDEAGVAHLAPLFDCMGSETVVTGAAGLGIRVKIINNYMSIALNALSAEAAALCEAIDLPLDTAMKVMSGTPAGNGHFTTTWPGKVLKGDLSPAFMIDLAHKDIGIALDLANQMHLPMPMGSAAREQFSAARAAGRGRQDWSAILEQVRASGGLPHH
ncbi:4-hydroxybutyrate dehydrogenase/sulfolactaldehyde 3-reductase [Aliiruegeria haliotis]|uniref:4-hydroxybutyrate dehydrogenase/sulfolactaldehyde 3-reductase n=1 Tax=Aliiruegeria haliotis TaxID=1280846 RepID=A0A2T0RT62_9RHOB|nr:sulfolactaldehyde 3-reductase [Aliiruegeria haliotis]PRY24273.1 4-hydroxybutyrate dehydrogenase/sulfolactaldehyde 3-reductase [Aliiruegeria haliotis]